VNFCVFCGNKLSKSRLKAYNQVISVITYLRVLIKHNSVITELLLILSTSFGYNTILLKDIVKRYNIRNVALLERFASYFFGGIALRQKTEYDTL